MMMLDDFVLEGGEQWQPLLVLDENMLLGGGVKLVADRFGGVRKVGKVSARDAILSGAGYGTPVTLLYNDDVKFKVVYHKR
jgi:hypothetical protein